MTSLIAARGCGRSASVIPAIPAAWSVTTIAFIGPVSSVCPCREHSPRSAARPPSEPFGRLAGGGVRGLAPWFGVGDRQVGTKRDGLGVGDAGPAKPLVEVGRLEVDAEGLAATVAVHT